MDKKNNNIGKMSRRNFFKSATLGIGAALTFFVGFPLIDSIVSSSKSMAKKVFSKLAPVNIIPNSFSPVTQPTKLNFSKTDQDAFINMTKPEQVWVVKKASDDIKVFSPICPHLGCRYNWNKDKELFICPCHNSVYTIDGKVVSGPAPRGLDVLPIEIKDESLYVKYEKFEVGIPEKIIID